MSKDDDQPVYTSTDESKNFDMYHFFSRWDVLLMIGFIILMIIYLLSFFLTYEPQGMA